jgi:hypothetical protein
MQTNDLLSHHVKPSDVPKYFEHLILFGTAVVDMDGNVLDPENWPPIKSSADADH